MRKKKERTNITKNQFEAARALMDMTQQDVADCAGISTRRLISYEDGDPSVSEATIQKILAVYQKAKVQFLKNGVIIKN